MSREIFSRFFRGGIHGWRIRQQTLNIRRLFFAHQPASFFFNPALRLTGRIPRYHGLR
jgi:hypothetical protein